MKRRNNMKKHTRLFAALLAVFLVITAMPFVSAFDESDYEGKIVYLDDTGNDDNDGSTKDTPVSSLTKAFEILGLEGGTVAVVDTYTHDKGVTWFAKEADGMKEITITGYDENSTFVWNRSLNPDGPLRIEYITFRITVNYAYLNAKGHNLVMGKGIKVYRDEGIKTDFLIRGGGDTNVGVEGDTNVTVYSGTYSSICGGSRNADIWGSTHITVYGGNIGSINGGNNNGSDGADKTVKGDAYITILGGSVVNCVGDDAQNRVEGKRILDVSRYPLAKSDWFSKFDEVKEYDPNAADAKKKIEVRAEGAFINGYSDGTFRPQNTITRAEAITMISRLIAAEDEIKSGKYETKLTDLPKDAWYFSNVAYLESLGLLDFMEKKGGVITPTAPITREEVCGLLYQLGKSDTVRVPSFSDVTAKNNLEAIAALASIGIVNGYSDGTFRPKGTITRAEFVTMTDRFLGRKTAESADFANKFNDVATHWAKDYIIAGSSESTVDGKTVWTVDKTVKKFELSADAKTAKDYIAELRKSASTLTAEAVTEGIDFISEKRIDEIRNTKTNITVTGKTYYVAADGDDTADGLSEATAWQSLKKVSTASLNSGDAVLFKRGDLFRGQIRARTGVTYSAYGEGAKPKIYGWDKNSADPSLWKETDVKGVWEYAEKYTLDIGNIVFDDATTARKVIRSDEKDGKHLDYRANREFNDYHDLTENMTFYHDYKGTGKIYLRCEAGNPGSLYKEIEMAKKEHTIQGGTAKNVTIDNLEIAYAGSHGIGFGETSGLTVTNCELKWIGGSIQTEIGAYNRTWPTPYGNAIEIYGSAVDYTVDNCYIWQAYDAGVTHQSGVAKHKNVHYINNVIEKCVYDIEIFVGEDEDGRSAHEDIYIENNILRKGGGFGHDQRPDTGVTAIIRNGGITKNTKNFTATNNIFDRSKGKIVSANTDGGSMLVYTDNLFVQAAGYVVIQKNGTNYFSDVGIRSGLEALGDKNNEFIIVSADKLKY